MDRMIYVAMSGAKETLIAQANNSNNLANVNTPGFMEDLNQFRSMPVFGPGFPSRVYALDERPDINFEKGAEQATGNVLDVAVKGDGYFAVQAPNGSEAYTRRGDLKVDANGLVTNGEGLPLIGNSGPIALPPFERIEIAHRRELALAADRKPIAEHRRMFAAFLRSDCLERTQQFFDCCILDRFHIRNGSAHPNASITLA